MESCAVHCTKCVIIILPFPACQDKPARGLTLRGYAKLEGRVGCRDYIHVVLTGQPFYLIGEAGEL